MMLRKETKIVNAPDKLTPGGILLLGTTVKVPLDNAWPIEEIQVTFSCTAGATGPTLSGADNILGILKNATLEVTDDNDKPFNAVDCSGMFLLEYSEKVGLNLPRATRASVALCQAASIANNQKFRITYRIPIVHPMITEPLRTRMLLPVHTYQKAPILYMDIEQAANMYSAGALSGVGIEVVLIRRKMPQTLTDSILASGGFIKADLVESNFAVTVGYAGEIRVPINGPGSYLNQLFRLYKGGASITRDVIDNDTTFGAESKWSIQVGGVNEHEFRMKHLQDMGDLSGVLNHATQSGSPSFAGAVASGTSYQPASSVLLDFLTDGLDSADELGSILDCNTPLKANLKVELVGQVSSAATNAHVINYGGHRLYGDLSKWQAVRS